MARKRKEPISYNSWAAYRDALNDAVVPLLDNYGKQTNGWFSWLGFGKSNDTLVAHGQIRGEPLAMAEVRVARFEGRNWLFRGFQRTFTSIKKQQSLLRYVHTRNQVNTLLAFNNPTRDQVTQAKTHLVKMIFSQSLSWRSRLRRSIKGIKKCLEGMSYDPPIAKPAQEPRVARQGEVPRVARSPVFVRKRAEQPNPPQRVPFAIPGQKAVDIRGLETLAGFIQLGTQRARVLLERNAQPGLTLQQVDTLMNDATELQKQLKKAYRQLSLQCHPDKVPGEEAEEQFKELGVNYHHFLKCIELIHVRGKAGDWHKAAGACQAEFDAELQAYQAKWAKQFAQLGAQKAKIWEGLQRFDEHLAQFDDNLAQFDDNLAQFDDNLAQFDERADRLEGQALRFLAKRQQQEKQAAKKRPAPDAEQAHEDPLPEWMSRMSI